MHTRAQEYIYIVRTRGKAIIGMALRAKKILDIKICVYDLQLKCMGALGGHFFSEPSLHREYYRTL